MLNTKKRDLIRWFIELVILSTIFSNDGIVLSCLSIFIILLSEYQDYQIRRINLMIKINNDNIKKLAATTKTDIRTKTREDKSWPYE